MEWILPYKSYQSIILQVRKERLREWSKMYTEPYPCQTAHIHPEEKRASSHENKMRSCNKDIVTKYL
jgi:hypothetical protein